MIILGRRDYIDLPEFDLTNIEAKIDTGAYGCSLHCHEIIIEHINGKDTLKFKLLDPDHPEYEDKYICTTEFSDKLVKNSGGVVEHRFTIYTRIVLFDVNYDVEFSLTDRKKMRYPILLGRKFLKKRFLIDVSQKNVSRKKKNQNKIIK
jgi:hypothetical protein